MATSDRRPVQILYSDPLPVNKENPENYFITLHLKATQLALKELSGNAFKLWVYIAKNHRTRTRLGWDLVRTETTRDCGFAGGTFDSARKELVDKNYLVPFGEEKVFIFYELPQLNTKEASVWSPSMVDKDEESQKEITREVAMMDNETAQANYPVLASYGF